MADNPLYRSSEETNTGLPPFRAILPEHVIPALDQVLAENRAALKALLADPANHCPDQPVQQILKPLEALDDRLTRLWSPVGHLNAVMNNDDLRTAYNACLPKLSEYSAELGQNSDLCNIFKHIRASAQWESLNTTERRVVENALRDFHLSGVDLRADQQGRYKEIRKRLSELSSKYAENVLDCGQAFYHHTTDPAELAGLPESQRQAAKQAALEKGKEGWWLTLDAPVYIAVLTYADRQALREKFYHAYSTRASDQSPNIVQDRASTDPQTAHPWDNAPLMREILALRHELAQLLGYPNYAEYSLATKMASSAREVLEFLHDLAERSRTAGEKEFAALQGFARENYGCETLNAWDVAYYSEKLKEQRYAVSQEALRPWFPLPKVLDGLFQVTHKLFGVRFETNDQIERWHEDVLYFDVYNSHKKIAGFYLDAYTRSGKRSGAWMDDCRVRRLRSDGSLQLPVAYLTCNFNRPVGEAPALLTHNEVTTLFHEFGHGLHHMLTRIDAAPVSGINGVAWDAVELPSQFMENWCWEGEALRLISGFYNAASEVSSATSQTVPQAGDPLPQELLDKMLAARHFQSAMFMLRQLEFATFDMRLHAQYTENTDIHAVLEQVRQEIAVVPTPAFNRFECGFSHIFAGGYAAGYYSYKWAEVLSADAFSRFEEDGIFNSETGRAFRTAILENGGALDAMALFVQFRGRKPSIDALLRHSGLLEKDAA
ncbi:Oligopeptidase A [gamma proteobacterium HdN1]|nr:Oligopeptidase A [gamma proteobacterium HdN1]